MGGELCSVSCGGGIVTERRYCRNENLRRSCRGTNTRVRQCNTEPCPTWSTWTHTTECSKTCGYGQQIQSRYHLFSMVGQSSRDYTLQ